MVDWCDVDWYLVDCSICISIFNPTHSHQSIKMVSYESVTNIIVVRLFIL